MQRKGYFLHFGISIFESGAEAAICAHMVKKTCFNLAENSGL